MVNVLHDINKGMKDVVRSDDSIESSDEKSSTILILTKNKGEI